MPTILPINLRQSICTDTPTGADLFQFGDEAARHLVNTGMERNGGLTPVYELETTFPTAGVSTMVAKDGAVVQVDAAHNVRLDDTVIGNVGPLAIKNRGVLKGYLDAAWTADETLIAINRIGTSMYVYEIDPATGAILHSRSNVFAGMPALIVNICLVKYVDMHYADDQEFIAQTSDATNEPYVLREAGTSTTNVVGTATNFPTVFFCWRFAAAKYIYGTANNSVQSVWYTGDLTAATTDITPSSSLLNGVFISIDRFPGTAFSRAIITFGLFKNAANLLTGYGVVGYTSAGAYSGAVTYYGIALAAVTATVVNPITGPGYSEATFTRSDTGANIYSYYAAPFAHNIAAYYVSDQTNTHTSINAYGKLTDIYDAVAGANVVNLVAWRICFINGVQSFISAAPMGTTWDIIGVPITNVGEFDDSFVPIVTDDGAASSQILYRYNGNLFYVNITSTATHTLQKVGNNSYMVNCLSALNAINVAERKLSVGSCDYNGRLLWKSAAAAGATGKIVGLVQGQFANSTDTGEKLSVQGLTFFLFGVRLFCPGSDVPSFWDRKNDYAINIYVNPSGTSAYMGSFIGYTIPVFVSDFTGIAYVPDTRIPFGMGYTFHDRIMQTEIETVFTGVGVTGSADIEFDYLCYELGNDIPGLFKAFQLYGQTYIFDGQSIWLSSFNGSLFNGRGNAPVADAAGMQLIATSPTAIYFLSSFDNSLYIYNGGRSLEKSARLNGADTISAGVFSIHDNSLLLNGTNSFIWIRDGIASSNAKKANQAGTLGLYDTVDGIVIANLTMDWNYTFFTQGSATVVPFTWQSAYLGVTNNKLGVITAFYETLYSAIRVQAIINITIDGFDLEGAWHEDHYFTIQPGDWDTQGFWRSGRVTPEHTLSLGVSVGLVTTSRLVLNLVQVEFEPSITATPQAARSS